MYSGSWSVEKKFYYFDYLIRTPGRKKGTQLWHVNMLIPYYERGESDTRNVSCADTVDECGSNDDLMSSKCKPLSLEISAVLSD